MVLDRGGSSPLTRTKFHASLAQRQSVSFTRRGSGFRNPQDVPVSFTKQISNRLTVGYLHLLVKATEVVRFHRASVVKGGNLRRRLSLDICLVNGRVSLMVMGSASKAVLSTRVGSGSIPHSSSKNLTTDS